MLACPDLEAAFGGGPGSLVEHGLGEVGQRDVVSATGEIDPGVSAAGSHIENFGTGRERHAFGRGANVVHIFQDVALAVAMALPGELFLGGTLDFVEIHTRRNGIGRSERRMASMRLKPKLS